MASSTTGLFTPKGIQGRSFWDSTVKGWKHSGVLVAKAMSCSISCGKHVTMHYCSNPKYLKLFRPKVSSESRLICLKHEKRNTEVSWHYPHFHKPLQLLTDVLQFKQERSQIHPGISTVRQKKYEARINLHSRLPLVTVSMKSKCTCHFPLSICITHVEGTMLCIFSNAVLYSTISLYCFSIVPTRTGCLTETIRLEVVLKTVAMCIGSG